jgi:hypothetical protein
MELLSVDVVMARSAVVGMDTGVAEATVIGKRRAKTLISAVMKR